MHHTFVAAAVDYYVCCLAPPTFVRKIPPGYINNPSNMSRKTQPLKIINGKRTPNGWILTLKDKTTKYYLKRDENNVYLYSCRAKKIIYRVKMNTIADLTMLYPASSSYFSFSLEHADPGSRQHKLAFEVSDNANLIEVLTGIPGRGRHYLYGIFLGNNQYDEELKALTKIDSNAFDYCFALRFYETNKQAQEIIQKNE